MFYVLPKVSVKTTRAYTVYIVTNRSGTLYTGVTGDLMTRVVEHRSATPGSFTAKYRIDRLVWFEMTSEVLEAITREKQIKNWSRQRKLDLINLTNPQWMDLAADWAESVAPIRRQGVISPVEGGLPRPGAPPLPMPPDRRRRVAV